MQTYSNYRISLKKCFSRQTLTDFVQLNKAAKNLKSIKTHQSYQEKQKQGENKKQTLLDDTKTQKLLPVIKRLSQQTKTFFFQSSDNYIKRILTQNGWIQSILDNGSNSLKWVTLAKPQHFQNLENNQMINHFKDSYKLTTKIGLFNLLTSPHSETLTDEEGRNYMKYFPRSYDLRADFESFKNDFEHTAVLNLMKKLIIHIEILHQNSLFIKYKKIVETNKRINIWKDQQNMIIRLQHAMERQNEFFDHRPSGERIKINGKLFVFLVKYFLDALQGNKTLQQREKQYLLEHSKQLPPFSNFHNALYLSHYGAIILFEIYFYCLNTYPYFLDDGLNNIWVVKLNESSRGRSIKLIDDIQAARIFEKDGNKLVQKYVENVWILKDKPEISTKKNKICKIVGRKFDLRFWVLVKSFLPLEAYIYEEGYLRLSSQSYKLQENGTALEKNIKTHLTNYSVNYGKNNNKQNQLSAEKSDQDSYLLFSDFVSFVENDSKKSSQSVLFKKIMKKIHHILMAASNTWRTSQTDKNSFELFGFDVILDDELQPFILQCNMSPACHQRGELKEVVEKMGKGLLEIIGSFGLKNNECQQNQDWIRLSKQKNDELITKKNGKLNIEQTFLNNKNYKDLFVSGQNIEPQKLINQDITMNSVQKLIFLQNFLKNRYSIKKTSIRQKNISRSCLLIENLAKILKKNKIIWVKKFIKYTKKYIKRSEKYSNEHKEE